MGFEWNFQRHSLGSWVCRCACVCVLDWLPFGLQVIRWAPRFRLPQSYVLLWAHSSWSRRGNYGFVACESHTSDFFLDGDKDCEDNVEQGDYVFFHTMMD